jgi:MFS family permease
MLSRVRAVLLDVSPLRESRDFRVLVLGQIVSNLGTQVALVALPFQIFVISHSAFLVGLLGAFELGPMVVVSLLGGALADRAAPNRPARRPSITVTRASIVPRVIAPERLRAGLAFSYGTYQLTAVVGPALGGLLIARLGAADGYLIDVGTCLAMAAAALSMSPQPQTDKAHPAVLRSVLQGLRFVRRNNALAGSFAIDLMAMTTAWPRAMFAVLALTVYHAGAGGTGVLFAALAIGATGAALTAAGSTMLGGSGGS